MAETNEKEKAIPNGRKADMRPKASADAFNRESTLKQEAVQEKIILYQILQKHMENLSQNAALLERRYEELEMTRQALNDIGRLKESNEILIPIGSGFFGRGKISDSRNMLADVGAGVFLSKDTESSKAMLEEKKKEIEKLADEMQEEMNEVSSRISSLAMEIEQASQQQEHKHEHVGKSKSHPHEDA